MTDFWITGVHENMYVSSLSIVITMVDFLCFCSVNPLTSPEKRLEDLLRLGELCIEVLQQNEEHHSEVWLVLLFWWNTHIDALS